MSLFGSLMGDFDDDIFGNHMNAMNMQMRSMNRMMNTFMPDPFNMLNNFDGGFQQNALMERQNPHPMGGLFGFPAMPNMNRLLSADIGNNPGGAAFCSSSVITMSSGPDGRPQIYQATSSTKTGPGGIRETRRTVQDSVNGVKKMAIGHHIGDRAHIIEKEQDLRSGQLEEHQEFINLEEDDAEDFDREFITKAGGPSGRGGARAICAAPVPQQALTIEEIDDDDDDVIETVPQVQMPSSSTSQHRRQMPAIPAPSQPPSTQIHPNSSTSKLSTTTSNSATKMSPSSSSVTSRNNINAGSSALYTTSARSTAMTAKTSSTPSTTKTTSVNDKPYLSTTPRRSTYRGSRHLSEASARRPLRTPPSSPLATTPTLHSHSTASTPSVHPHPYNTSAARRSHHHHHHHHHQHRSKQHATKQYTAPTSSNSINQTTVAPSQPRKEDSNSK